MAFDLDGIFDFGSKVIERIWPDPTEAEKAKIRLAELAQNGELAELANKSDMFKAEVEDRKSARERESAIATAEDAPYINKIVTPILAIGVVVSTFLLFSIVIFKSGLIAPEQKDIVIYILGVLSAVVTQVIQYFFGSSSGSTQTRGFLERLAQK